MIRIGFPPFPLSFTGTSLHEYRKQPSSRCLHLHCQNLARTPHSHRISPLLAKMGTSVCTLVPPQTYSVSVVCARSLDSVNVDILMPIVSRTHAGRFLYLLQGSCNLGGVSQDFLKWPCLRNARKIMVNCDPVSTRATPSTGL